MVFWTLRLCIPLLLSWDFGVRPCMHAATYFLDLRVSSTFSLCGNIFWNIFTHSFSRCYVSAVLSHWVASRTLHVCLLLAMLLFHGFSGPNPWLFYFLHGHFARVSSTKSNDFNVQQLNFDVTGFKNTQASRDNNAKRSRHFSMHNWNRP